MVIEPRKAEGNPRNPHHGIDQWLFVVGGSGVATVNGRRHALRPGVILMIERDDHHEIRNRLLPHPNWVPAVGPNCVATTRATVRTRGGASFDVAQVTWRQVLRSSAREAFLGRLLASRYRETLEPGPRRRQRSTVTAAKSQEHRDPVDRKSARALTYGDKKSGT